MKEKESAYHSLFSEAKELFGKIRSIRREIHEHPELSFREERTSALLSSLLEEAGIYNRKVARTGILARIDGNDSPSDDVVVLRADMDALPICEKTPVPFASRNGAMHACGHDIHTASLLGALLSLNKRKNTFSGTVLGLFQPGEEQNPGGASIVLKEGVFKDFSPKVFIAQHVAPEIPAGSYGTREGLYMASTDEVRFTITGKGGHGALPHTLTDPVTAGAALITALQTIASRNANPILPTVLSFGRFIAEGATNVIPDNVHIEGTFRTMDEEWRNKALQRIEEIANGIASAYGVKIAVNISRGYPCVRNNPEYTQIVRNVLEELVSPAHVEYLDMRMTGEDFGFYTQQYPSVFFRLGVGHTDGTETSNLHSATFYPNEEALVYGITALTALALRFRQ